MACAIARSSSCASSDGPAQVQRLLDLGVRLARDANGALDLGREGAPHAAPRRALGRRHRPRDPARADRGGASKHPNITVLEDHIAVDLLSMAKYGGDPACFGAYVLDSAHRRGQDDLRARDRARDRRHRQGLPLHVEPRRRDRRRRRDGVSHRRGVSAISSSSSSTRRCSTTRRRGSFLISEALRGEGGVLRLASGETFMENYHPMKSLAPRDIVARAIDNELKKSGADCVLPRHDAPRCRRSCAGGSRTSTSAAWRSASTSRSSRSRSCPRRTTCAAA